MIRCALLELLFPGCGYALGGNLRMAAIAFGALLLSIVGGLFTPWALWLAFAVRLAAMIDAGRRGRRGPPIEGWQWKPMLLVASIAFGAALTTRLYVIEAYKIPSVSMAPTLALDDLISVDKVSIHWRPPQRGEIVTFDHGGRTWVKRVMAVGGDTIAVRGGVPFVNGTSTVQRPLGRTHYVDRDEDSRQLSRQETFLYEERFAGRVYQVYGAAPDESREMHDYPRTDAGPPCEAQHLGYGGDPDTVSLIPTTDGACRVPMGTLFFMGDNRDNSNDSRVWGAMPVEHVFGRVVGIWMGGEGQRLGRIGGID